MSKKVKILLALVVAVLLYKMVATGGSTVEVDYDVDEE